MAHKMHKMDLLVLISNMFTVVVVVSRIDYLSDKEVIENSVNMQCLQDKKCLCRSSFNCRGLRISLGSDFSTGITNSKSLSTQVINTGAFGTGSQR